MVSFSPLDPVGIAGAPRAGGVGARWSGAEANRAGCQGTTRGAGGNRVPGAAAPARGGPAGPGDLPPAPAAR
jgi:hypothetical protein